MTTKKTKTTKAKKTASGVTPGANQAMATIYWECTAGPDWNWLSGDPSQTPFPVSQTPSLGGTIVLPPNPNYWYPCIQLVFAQDYFGYVCLRFFQRQSGNTVQAMVYCPQGGWNFVGQNGSISSETEGNGGFNLSAAFVPIPTLRKRKK
jgi:hypothetical protein